jgi:hypothetical protein
MHVKFANFLQVNLQRLASLRITGQFDRGHWLSRCSETDVVLWVDGVISKHDLVLGEHHGRKAQVNWWEIFENMVQWQTRKDQVVRSQRELLQTSWLSNKTLHEVRRNRLYGDLLIAQKMRETSIWISGQVFLQESHFLCIADSIFLHDATQWRLGSVHISGSPSSRILRTPCNAFLDSHSVCNNSRWLRTTWSFLPLNYFDEILSPVFLWLSLLVFS